MFALRGRLSNPTHFLGLHPIWSAFLRTSYAPGPGILLARFAIKSISVGKSSKFHAFLEGRECHNLGSFVSFARFIIQSSSDMGFASDILVTPPLLAFLRTSYAPGPGNSTLCNQINLSRQVH